MKKCPRCGASRPLDQFGGDRVTPDGLKAYCKACCADYNREYRKRDPERFKGYEATRLERHGDKRRDADRERWAATRADVESASRARFARKIRKLYGITLDEYDALVDAPCFLCGKTDHVVLDHCHDSGKIRGPLCKGCNAALGVFGDDPARLRSAADYLEAHRVK